MSSTSPMQSNNPHAICGAKTRSGKPCQSKPMPNGRCRMHGGSTPHGAELPQFKHGKFSKYLPNRLMEIYEDVESDLEHNLLSRNIKLRETFLREKLAMLDDAPDSREAWEQLRDSVDEMTRAFENDDLGLVKIGLMSLDRLINNMQAYHMAVDEIRSDLAEQRKDKQTLSAIEYKGENAVPITELMSFVSAILNLISTTVSNANERNKIYDAIDRLTRVEESPAREPVAIEASG